MTSYMGWIYICVVPLMIFCHVIRHPRPRRLLPRVMEIQTSELLYIIPHITIPQQWTPYSAGGQSSICVSAASFTRGIHSFAAVKGTSSQPSFSPSAIHSNSADRVSFSATLSLQQSSTVPISHNGQLSYPIATTSHSKLQRSTSAGSTRRAIIVA